MEITTFEQENTRLGNKIKSLRKAKNLSQEQFGEMISIKKGSLSAIENGNRNITLKVIHKIAVALEIPICKLF